MANGAQSLLDRARARARKLQARLHEVEAQGGLEAWLRASLEEELARQQRRLANGMHAGNPLHAAQVRLWYARLELEPGSDAAAVRRQFRALMRRYHPDRFTARGEGEKLATQLSQELTVAYEGLLDHLGEH
jgi:DnaJ-domain-containing protein 1